MVIVLLLFIGAIIYTLLSPEEPVDKNDIDTGW